MKRIAPQRLLATIGLGWFVLPLLLAAPAVAEDALGPNPTWKPAAAETIRAQATEWLKSQPIDDAARAQALALWPAENDQASGAELLERLAQTFAVASAEVRPLIELCARPDAPVLLPEFPWLLAEQTPPLVRNNLRLYYARWLAQHNLYDEALVQVADVQVEDVVDPASLLFYQAVSHHRLVAAAPGQKAAQRLLEREAELPQRYRQLAHLMAQDLQTLKEDSLDHIARRMDDIHRRLDRGRAGKKVREVEDGVIASLDKLIKELEDQQQQQSGGAGAGGGQGAQSAQPAPDSRILTQKGPGNVDRKNIGKTPGWGTLPPKEREEALQQIGKEFPAHFRDAIEQYFRKIAAENEQK